MKDKFKYFKEMIKTRDKDKEKFNELIKNSLHDEYMYVRETALVVGDEMIDHVNNLFDEGLITEDIKLLYEDEDTFLWKDIIRIDGKRFLTTNVQFWKDGKNWREMVGGKEVSDEFTSIKPLLVSRAQMIR
tara:strand:+ start:743 stop:1135 length:393 start_codon:yes stop_codon:yes gene_type:complete